MADTTSLRSAFPVIPFILMASPDLSVSILFSVASFMKEEKSWPAPTFSVFCAPPPKLDMLGILSVILSTISYSISYLRKYNLSRNSWLSEELTP